MKSRHSLIGPGEVARRSICTPSFTTCRNPSSVLSLDDMACAADAITTLHAVESFCLDVRHRKIVFPASPSPSLVDRSHHLINAFVQSLDAVYAAFTQMSIFPSWRTSSQTVRLTAARILSPATAALQSCDAGLRPERRTSSTACAASLSAAALARM